MTASIEIADVAKIACRIAPYDWPFARDDGARIDRHWTDLRERKPRLFDGRVLLSRGLVVTPKTRTLTGHSFEVAYRAFLGWRDFGFPGAPVHNLFAMTALRAADGAFMLGRMSVTTANGGRLYFPAGTPEPSDAGPDGFVDFDANIRRELVEETGLTHVDLSFDDRWTIVFAGPLVAAMKIARSALSSGELTDRVADFIEAQTHPELDGLVPIRDESGFEPDRMPAFMLAYLRHVWSLEGVSA